MNEVSRPIGDKRDLSVDLFPRYAAVQNGVILAAYPSLELAEKRIEEEKQKDLISIMFKRKLRKIFKKSGNIALHSYCVITVVAEEDLT